MSIKSKGFIIPLLLFSLMPIFKAVSHENCTSFALNQMGSEKSTRHEFREHTKEGEKRFNEILDVLEELFTEEFKARGGELKMARYEWPFNSLETAPLSWGYLIFKDLGL